MALTLRTLGGLSTREVARAFLTGETAMQQRLVRAKRKIQHGRHPLRGAGGPPPAGPTALGAGVALPDLQRGLPRRRAPTCWCDASCATRRSGSAVCWQLMPDEPEVRGLLALMLLSHSRRDARVDERGDMVLLEDQDRSLWRRDELEQGLALAARPASGGSTGSRPRSPPSTLARRGRTPPTGRASRLLYERLAQLNRSAVVELNRAVAIAMADGPQRGLRLLDELERRRARRLPPVPLGPRRAARPARAGRRGGGGVRRAPWSWPPTRSSGASSSGA